MRTPSFHIFCAGTTTVPYARVAAECLAKSAGGSGAVLPRIVVHLIAIPAGDRERVRDVFKPLESVELVEDLMPLQRNDGMLPGLAARLLPVGKRRAVAARFGGRGFLGPLLRAIIGDPGHFYLGHYHHEWISAVCETWSQDEALVIMDADFFNHDSRLFERERCELREDTFAGGWVWRDLDTANYQGREVMPLGSELVILNPRKFAKMNCQRDNVDPGVFRNLGKAFPGITFRRDFIDTLYGPCWKAQLSGEKVDTRFAELGVCHVGGFSHIHPAYLRERSPGTDQDEWLRVWIRRGRLNSRVLEVFRGRGLLGLVSQERLRALEELRETADRETVLRELWATLEPSSDERALVRVEELLAGGPEQAEIE